MATLIVCNGADRSTVEFQPPQSLDQLLKRIGLSSDHPCGGRGTCGKCSVRIRGHISDATP